MISLIFPRPDDAQALATLHAACFVDPWSAASFRQMLKEPLTFCIGAQSEGDLAGFALVQIVAGEADLLTIATLPALQRRGVAKSLMTALMSRLGERGVSRVTLEVAEDNVSARKLYEHFGFAEDGRRAGYYSEGRATPVDAVLMSRTLQISPAPSP